MPCYTLLSANRRRVLFWAEDALSAQKGLDNCPGITAEEKKKVIRVCKPFLHGGQFPNNKQKFKSVQNQKDIFAIKSFQLRLPGIFRENDFIILCCLRKKKDKYNKQDLKKMQQYKQACLSESP